MIAVTSTDIPARVLPHYNIDELTRQSALYSSHEELNEFVYILFIIIINTDNEKFFETF